MAVEDGSRVDRRQLLLVALAVGALIAAAFLAPMVDPPDESGGQSPDGNSGENPGASGSGDGTGGVGLFVANGSADPPAQRRPACLLIFTGEPTPGAPVTMQLRHQGAPVAGATIWLNGENLGRTGPDGRLTAEVPYEQELRVRINVPGQDPCDTDGQPAIDSPRHSSIDPGLASPLAGQDHPLSAVQLDQPDGNGTLVVPVEGPLTVTVEDRPEPGSSVTIRASIRGVPVEDGTVIVDGDIVGQTDERGRYELSIPADGTEAVRIRVARGDFAGTETIHLGLNVSVNGRPFPGETVTVEAEQRERPVANGSVAVDGAVVGRTDERGRYELSIPDDGTDTLDVTVSDGSVSETRTVDVLRLEVRVQPRGLLLVPGGRATVVATRGDERVPNATVLVAGQQVGTTGADGRLDLRLPTETGATVTVRTDRQSATVELAAVYRATAIAVAVYGLIAAALAALAARTRNRRAGWGVAAGGAVLFVLALAHSLAGGVGLAVAALVVALPVVAVVASRRREIATGGRSIAGLLRDLPGQFTALALWATRVIEHWIDWIATLLGGLATVLARRPRSLSALRSRLLTWLGTIPGRTYARVQQGSLRLAGVVGGAAALTVAGVVAGWPGVLAALLVVLLVVAVYRWRTREEPTKVVETETLEGSPTPTSVDQTEEPTDSGRPSLRERWRTFARWVRPGSWHVSSPGEVARAAREEGYPAKAVRTLTAAFQRREYSERSLPSSVRDRAEAAFEHLESHREGGED